MLSGLSQIVVALSAGIALNNDGFATRFVGVVAEAALHVLITSMGGGGDGRVQLLLMAGATQFRFGVPQDGRMLGTMREVTEVAFFLGDLGMRLHYRAPMIVVAGIACFGDGCHHHLGIGPSVRRVAIGALPILKGFVPMCHRCIRISYILPVAVPTDLLDSSPQLIWIRTVQIVASTTSAIAKRLVDEVQTVHTRRP